MCAFLVCSIVFKLKGGEGNPSVWDTLLSLCKLEKALILFVFTFQSRLKRLNVARYQGQMQSENGIESDIHFKEQNVIHFLQKISSPFLKCHVGAWHIDIFLTGGLLL